MAPSPPMRRQQQQQPTSPLRLQQQQQQQQLLLRQQQEQQQLAANDDLLPEALPAFPQPVSSLPRDTNTLQYFPVAAPAGAPGNLLPVSSSAHSHITTQQQQQQQQQQLPWGPGPGSLPYMPAAAAVNGSAAPHSYAGLDMPYDVAIAPYAAVYGASYASERDVPFLLGSQGFVSDMVFANRSVRHAFLRRVLALLALQLLLTAAITAPLLHDKHARHFLRRNPWVLAIASITFGMLLLVLAWSERARRRYPLNLLLLGVFTAMEGLLLTVASATYATHALLIALLISAAVSIALIVYASQTTLDFTASGGMLFSAGVVLASVVLADMWLGFRTLHLLTGGCVALLFCAWMVCDIHSAATGESSHTMAADEVVFAAFNVFTDVITHGMYMLQMCSAADGHPDDDFCWQ